VGARVPPNDWAKFWGGTFQKLKRGKPTAERGQGRMLINSETDRISMTSTLQRNVEIVTGAHSGLTRTWKSQETVKGEKKRSKPRGTKKWTVPGGSDLSVDGRARELVLKRQAKGGKR